MSQQFYFLARDQAGALEYGLIDTVSRAQAVEILTHYRRAALLVETVVLLPQVTGWWRRGMRVTAEDCEHMTEHLALLLEHEIAIEPALNILADETTRPGLRSLITAVHRSVAQGASLSEALSEFPKTFSYFYRSLIKGAEYGGSLPIVLRQLARFLSAESALRARIIRSSAYPLLVGFASLCTLGILLGYVVPQLAEAFSDLDQAVPMVTKVLLGISVFTQASWGWIVLVGGIVIALLYRGRKHFLRYYFSQRWSLPGIGKLFYLKELSRFFMSCSMSLTSGVPLLEAVHIAQSIIAYSPLAPVCAQMAEDLINGEAFSASVKKIPAFPAFAVHMIRVSEETGSLPQALMGLARTYEDQTVAHLEWLMTLLEPMVMMVLGLIVGGVVMAMVIPIFQLTGTL